MAKPQIVVVDEGSNQIKVCWMDEKGKIKTHVIPSIIQDEVGTDTIGNQLKGNYKIGTEKFFVSPNIQHPLPTKRKGYQTSKENRVLVHEALRLAGFGGKDVKVVCTLPITHYFLGEGHKRNTELLAEKKDNITGTIANNSDTELELANIVDVAVAPESVPAWFDMQLSDQMEQDDKLYEAQMVMVVDIGGTTTDICVIDGTGMMQAKRTVDFGVYDIAGKLKTTMIENRKADSLLRSHLDAVLRRGEYRGFSCLEMIKEASKPVIKNVLYQMDDLVKDSESLDHILYVGGGAAIIGEDIAKMYGNRKYSHIPDNPDLAVAKGLLKLNMMPEME